MLPCLFLSSGSFSSGVSQVLVLVPLMSLPSWNHSISYFKWHTYTNADGFKIYISHTDFCFHVYTQMFNSGLMIDLFNKNFVSTWITNKLPKFNMSKTKYLIPSPSIPKQAPSMVCLNWVNSNSIIPQGKKNTQKNPWNYSWITSFFCTSHANSQQNLWSPVSKYM